jgi:predicted RNA binding protein YcfA (HicA-like mRNA interferase family)
MKLKVIIHPAEEGGFWAEVPAIPGKHFARILENHGWVLVRINGSYHVYMKSGNTARISLPIHNNEDLKIGLLRHFIKVAGITEAEL